MAVDLTFKEKLTQAGGLPPAKPNPVIKAAGSVPWVTTGPVARDSAGYSIMKAAGFCLGILSPDQCKEEIEVSKRLGAIMSGGGYQSHYQGKAFYVPASSKHLPPEAGEMAGELRQKMAASYHGADPDEAEYISGKMGLKQKAAWSNPMGTISDTAGGAVVGFPTLGELIDLQRHREAFARAGATEITLPPNGRISFPKLTGGATAYWVGEAGSITQSQQTTGSLLLEPKKIGVLVPINNELMRYAGTTAEGMIRTDMARVAALKADLGMLEGTGGTQIKGLTTYPTQTTWTQNVDKLINHVSVGTPASADSGYPFQPEDINLMLGKLPDEVDNATAWLVRTDWLAYLLNRRADAVTAADGKGQFVFDMWRSIAEGRSSAIAGGKIITTRQVNNNRVRGSGTTFTYALAGYFRDWIIGRHGVMEFMANPYGDQAFQHDQTVLRTIQIIDAGPRNAASFVLCDQLAFG